MSFLDAAAYCGLLGGTLPHLRYAHHHDEIAYLARSHRSDVWIGATDLRNEGHWQWHDDGSNAAPRSGEWAAHAWARGEPKPYEWTTDCAISEKAAFVSTKPSVYASAFA